MHVPRVFLDDAIAAPSRIVLPDDEAHHLARVLRARSGDAVRVFNGRGGEWDARVAAVAGSRVTIDIEARAPATPEPPVMVALALALLKGDQMDHAVRDATVFGAAAVVPIVAARSNVPSRAWTSGAAHERWRKVTIAAAKQCRRARVPAIEPVATFAAALAAATTNAAAFVCVPQGGFEQGPGEAPPRPDGPAVVFIGPEGGWTDEELAMARDAGATLVSLGPRILRAEAVPAAVLTTLWTWWGWSS